MTITDIEKQKNAWHVKRLLWLVLAGFIILCDQLSKWAITEVLFRPAQGQQGLDFITWYLNAPDMLAPVHMPVTSFFNLVMVWNKGISFGLLSAQSPYTTLFLILMAGAITLFFALWMLRTHDNAHGFCFAIIIGGAIGNIIDRIRFGAVIDFLDFHAFGYHWPAFNIADMAVVCGVGLLLILSIYFDLLNKDVYRNATVTEKK